MKDIDKISEKVEAREKQLQELFKKDEENYDLWAGKEQIFDTHPMAVNVTGGEMVALSHRTQSSINRSRIDIRVLPPNPLPNPDAEKTANLEEDMYYFGLEQADERLANKGEASLLSSASWDVTNLGRVPVRIVVYYDKELKKVVWDIKPMNPRFVTFSFDDKGLAWYRYETFRSPASIEEEYKKEATEDAQGKGVSVSDYWDREHNVVYLTKAKEGLKTWKHPFKEVPAIIQPVAGGPKAITTEGINVTTWGQSIFDPVKTMFRTLNKLRSIVATQAFINAQPPLVAKHKDGIDITIEEKDLSRYPMAVINVPDSVDLTVLDTKDVPASIMAMIGDIQATIEKATYAFINPDPSGHSGAALRILGQDKRDVETPGIEALNIMYTRTCRMMKKQILVQGLTIPVQTVSNGVYVAYDMKPDLLKNDFYVNAVLVSQDVYNDVEALQRAQMYLQLGLKSKRKVMEEVLLEQDVPNQIAEMTIEEVEAAIPEIKLKRAIRIYKDRGMEEEAGMAEEKLFLIEAQQRQEVIPPEAQGMLGQPPGGAPPGGAPRRVP